MDTREKILQITEDGTLGTLLTREDINYTTHLYLGGFLNADDLKIIEKMCDSWGRYDEYDEFIIDLESPPFLKWLDLSECELTENTDFKIFAIHSKLEFVSLPKNTKKLDDYDNIFAYSQFLKEIVLPDNLEMIDNSTFRYCKKLTNIELPKMLNFIGYDAFLNCSSLYEILIPKSVSFIGDGAFANCYKLKHFLVEKDSLYFKAIGGVLFDEGGNKLISFPCGFSYSNYSVPNGTKIIQKDAFKGVSIASITFPETIEIIEDTSFGERLQEIRIFAKTPPKVVHPPNNIVCNRLLVPKGCKGRYIKDKNWANFNVIDEMKN